NPLFCIGIPLIRVSNHHSRDQLQEQSNYGQVVVHRYRGTPSYCPSPKAQLK
ncbi:hypothetical protein GIB67_018523, partial [Kingdonia uniflora]